MLFYRLLWVLLWVLLQGCAGTRHSYQSQLEASAGLSILRMATGERREALAIGDGFPGWWGYYPSLISLSPEVVSVQCQATRSWIPFREPGLIFGGQICYLQAHQPGTSILLFGNRHHLSEDTYQERVAVLVSPPSASPRP